MSSGKNESLNEVAWNKLFNKYNILEQVNENGKFEISANQIKEFREPRLMAKFDHEINLPQIFSKNKLAILPITRGNYVISNFDAYHKFEQNEPVVSNITKVKLPTHIQSLDSGNITSEAIALNCAIASGIVSDFLEDEELIPTVSGRMGSGVFDFNIKNNKNNNFSKIQVCNSQIEIDAAYEGIKSLALFEAKRDLSSDFLIRQLYYPFRVWKDRISKPVRPLFLVYSNGIYRLYEYKFEDENNYNSLVLVSQKNYSIEDTDIEITDIQDVLNTTIIVREPEKIPFPQADDFDRVINICELLSEQELNRNNITEQFAFDVRQTNYYTDAARYLGLLDKKKDNSRTPSYDLSDKAKQILKLNFKQRQLALCKEILSHKAFADTLKRYFTTGVMPSKGEIVLIMKNSKLNNVGSDSTYERRASTIRGWIVWIVNLINN